MSEINETPEPTEPQPKSVEELTAEIATLTKELETANFWRTRITTTLTELESKVEQLEEYLDDEWDSIEAERVAEIMGIDTEVEKEVSVSISGTMTIKAPRSYDWDDLSYSSFEVSIETNWSETFTIESYDLDVNDTEVQD
jgi:predicted nuclease with TOPRIM domain